MEIQVLTRSLDESIFCPLCNGAMYYVDGEFNDHELTFNECSFCNHRVFNDKGHTCHCESCLEKRKKIIRETSAEEARVVSRKRRKVDTNEVIDLLQLSFMQKLFLLSILDEYVHEGSRYDEWIDWSVIRRRTITPNYLFQIALFKNLVKEEILVPTEFSDECTTFFVNVRLDGYAEPTLFSITHRLRQLFFENLALGIPFKSSDEVKDALYYVLYQEVVQFAQFCCKTWNVQISGNKPFQRLCVNLLDTLAYGQIIYMVQNALDYLHKNNGLQPRNDNFINTNYLKATLEKYKKRAVEERWENYTLPRPEAYPISRMTEILLFKFLGYDEKIFVQPVHFLWKRIEPRLSFYSVKRCMNCGGNELKIEYDQGNQVTMVCYDCKHTDHYFIEK